MFLAGDRSAIITAIENENEDEQTEEFTPYILETEGLGVDFTFHLIPKDLDILVQSICTIYQLPPTTLRENLDFEGHFYDTEHCGASYVQSVIRDIFAKVPEEDADAIAAQWFERLSALHNEALLPEPHVAEAIAAMIRLCRRAVDEQLDIVHYWSL